MLTGWTVYIKQYMESKIRDIFEHTIIIYISKCKQKEAVITIIMLCQRSR